MIDKNSEIGQAAVEFLQMDREMQARLLGYMKALQEQGRLQR